MSTFALSSSDTPDQVLSAINYALANLGSNLAGNGSGGANVSANIFANGNVLVANTTTGVVSSVTNTGATQVPVISYLYNYINVKYANSASGGSGFNSNSAYASYYGLRNSNSTMISSNPTDYTWTPVAGGFGTTKGLYYYNIGGNQINFAVANTAPTNTFSLIQPDTPIYLPTVANNAINTPQLVTQSATQAVNAVNNTDYPLINFVNGNATIGGTGYIWPNYTRGFAIGGGVAITPATTGSITGSQIQVNYNTLINTVANSTVQSYNLVELWKNGTSSFYRQNFRVVRAQTYYNQSNTAVDSFLITGSNGALYTGNLTSGITQTLTSTTNDLYDVSNAYGSSMKGTSTVYGFSQNVLTGGPLYGANGTFIWKYPTAVSSNTTATYTGTIGNWTGNVNVVSFVGGPTYPATPNFNIYGVCAISFAIADSGSFSPYYNLWSYALNNVTNILVGGGGIIYYYNYTNSGTEAPPTIIINQCTFETSGTFADLIDIACDLPSSYPYPGNSGTGTSPTFNYVAVGSGGTILYNSRSFVTSSGRSGATISTNSGWFQSSSPTIAQLNGIANNANITGAGTDVSNKYTRANVWVAVGNNGTVITSSSYSGPWTLANAVPTTQNLNSVTWANGTWVAVGDSGTILTSTNGSDWTGPIANPADGVTIPSNKARNLYGVAGGLTGGRFVTAGQEIILQTNNTNPTTGGWGNTYVGGASVTSTLTRLQYFGSGANIANTSQPAIQQQITNGQVISGTYVDTNYTAGNTLTYYLVIGNNYGNANVYTNGPNMTITEIKR